MLFVSIIPPEARWLKSSCVSWRGDRFEADSAGLEPGKINPVVVDVLKEEGIDIMDKKTKAVFVYINRDQSTVM